MTEPVRAVPSSLELAERELAAALNRELANEESLDFLDVVDGGRSGRGFSNGGLGLEGSEACVVVAEDILIEGTPLESRVLEGGSDVGCWRGVSSPITCAKKCCVCESSTETNT